MNKPASKVTQDRHQTTSVNQHQDTGTSLSGSFSHFLEHGSHDPVHPASRTQFESRRKPHAAQHQDEQRRSDGSRYLFIGNPRLDPFGLRDFLSQEHVAVDQRWNQHDTQLGLHNGETKQTPLGAGCCNARSCIADPEAKQCPDDDSHRPEDMEPVQPGGLVIGVHRRYQWITTGLDAAVTQRDDGCSRHQLGKTGGVHHQDDSQDVANERQLDRDRDTELLDKKSQQDDGDGKTTKRGAADPAGLHLGESEHRLEITHRRGDHPEGDRGRNQCNATGPEKTLPAPLIKYLSHLCPPVPGGMVRPRAYRPRR